MEIERRKTLMWIASATAGGFLCGANRARPLGPSNPVFASACAIHQDQFVITWLLSDGVDAWHVPLPGRGHSVAIRPDGSELVVFARRPGTFAVIVDRVTGRQVRCITSPQGRHFYGHGAFDHVGHFVYATENDYVHGRGVIGVYDASDRYRRVAEFPSHGIGPHEIKMHRDGERLVVANGGIKTHPEMPRVKLNVPTMESSICWIDRRTGQLRHRISLAKQFRQLSIRHIDVNRFGSLAVAMQYEGPYGDVIPLIGICDANGTLRLIDEPLAVIHSMKNYCGSVAFDASGDVLAVSSPRGGNVTFWKTNTGNFLSAVDIADGCGLSPTQNDGEFLTSGRGTLAFVHARRGHLKPLNLPGYESAQWDNHLCFSQV